MSDTAAQHLHNSCKKNKNKLHYMQEENKAFASDGTNKREREAATHCISENQF